MVDWTYIGVAATALGIEPPSTVSLDDICEMMWESVRRHRPLSKWATITTVANQGSYAIPTTDVDGNALTNPRVLEVYWDASGRTIIDYDPLVDTEVWDRTRSANIVSQLERLDGGAFEVIDSRIILTPTPTGENVVLSLIVCEKDDDDITEGDREAVEYGVMWVLYERIANSVARGGSFKAGSYAATANKGTLDHLGGRATFYKEQFYMMLSHTDEILTV